MIYQDFSVPDDAFKLAINLKSKDRFEIALFGLDPLLALLYPFRANRPNTITWTIFDGTQPIAMWGCVPLKNETEKATCWFLSSNEIMRNMRFLRQTKRAFNWTISHYKHLHNFVTEEQTQTIRWLKWLGFKFHSSPILVKNVKVMYFYYESCNKIQTEPIDDLCGPKWKTQMNLKVDNS